MAHQDQVTVELNTPKVTTKVVNVSDTTTPASTVNFVGAQGPAGPAGPALIFSGQGDNRVLTSHVSGSNSVTAEAGFLVDNSGDVFIQNDLTVSGNLNVSGDFTLGDSTTDSITTKGDLFVEDDAFFADAVHITGNLTVDGTASAANPTQNGHLTTKSYVDSVSTNLNTTGSLLHRDIHVVSGNLDTSNNNLVTTGAELRSDINELSGQVVFTTGEQTNIQGNKTFANDVNVLGNLSVSGNFTLGDDTTDRITTRGDLYVDDDAFFGDDVYVTGDLNTRSIYPSHSGLYDIGHPQIKYNNLYVKTGHFDGNTINLGAGGARITLSDAGEVSTVSEAGVSISAGSLRENPSVSGNLYVQSGVYVTGSAYIKENLVVTGNASAASPTQNGHLTTKSYVDSADSTLTTNLATTGSNLHRDLHSLSGEINLNRSDIDTISGSVSSNDTDIANLNTNLATTGSVLHRDLHAISGDTVLNAADIDSISGSLNSTNSNLASTGQNLQSQIASNDGDISTLTSNLASSGFNLETQIRNSGSNLQTDIRDLSGDAVFLTGSQTIQGNKTFSNNVTVLGDLAVSGDFVLGDESTDSITTRGDLFVEDDAFFADSVHVTGNLTVDGTASAATPTQNGHLTTKSYVDSADSTLTTNLAATGSNLHRDVHLISGDVVLNAADIDSLSGSLNTANTNLATTGSKLHRDIHLISGEASLNTADIDSLSGQVVFNTGQQNISGVKNFANDVTVGGNLTVDGTTITVNTSNVLVEDPVLYLAKNQTGSATLDAGFIAERGNDTNVGFIWDESEDRFATINTTEIADDNDITIQSYANLKSAKITSTSNIGIGLDSPSSSLHILKDSPELRLQGSASSGTKTNKIAFYNASNSLRAEIKQDYYGGSNNLILKSVEGDIILDSYNKRVGLGTTAPDVNFHIKTNNTPTIRLQDNTDHTKLDLVASDSVVTIGSNSNHPLTIKTNTYERIRIKTDGNVGIGTTSPSVKLHVESTDAIKVPVGTTAQRPTAAAGMLRLNTTTSQFEGYKDGNWQGLGGVIDVDQDTYVTTETTSDDDTLFFYTAGTERARINNNGSTHIKGDLTVSGSLNVSGDFVLGDHTTDKITTRGDLYVDDDAFFGDDATVSGDFTVIGTASAASPTQNGHLTTKSYVDSADSELAADIDIVSGLVVSNDSDLSTVTSNLATTGSNLHRDIHAVSGDVVLNAADVDSLSGSLNTTNTNLATTGSNLHRDIHAVSGDVVLNAADVDSLSGSLNTTNTNLATTGSNLHRDIHAVSGDVALNTADIDSLSGTMLSNYSNISQNSANLATTGSNLHRDIHAVSGSLNTTNSNIVTTGANLQSQISSNDSEILSLQSDVNNLSGDAVLLAGNQTIAGVKTFSNNAIFNGDLTVNGTTMTVDTSNVLVEDPVLLLAKNQAGSASLDAGFIAERGDDTNVGFIWDESDDHFAVINTTEAAADADITIASYANFKANLGVFSSNVTSLGSVGIGTASPNRKLVVSGGSARMGIKNSTEGVVLGLLSDDAGYLHLNNGSGTNTIQLRADTISYFNGGNFGIGTTSPGRKFTVQGGSNDNLPVRIIGGASTTKASLEFQDPTTTADYKVTLGSVGDHMFFQAGGSERVRIKSDGNVGIGTNTPSNKLDINGGLEVNGESYIRSTSNVGLRIQTTDQGITNSDGLRLGLNGTHAFLWVYENKPLALATNGAERATILGNGNFGIGTTSPDSNLDIEGTGSPELRVTDTTNTVGAYIQSNDTKTIFGSRTNHPVQIEQNAGAALYIDTSKNVGIGTTSPQLGSSWNKVLHVHSPDGVGSHIRFTDTTSGATGESGLYIGQYGNDSYLINRESGFMALRVNGTTDAIRIISSGKVGIGTNSPVQQLHVLGDAMRFERANNAVALQLYNNNASPADDAALGYLQFMGKDNDGTASIVHSEVRGGVQSNTDSAVSGYLSFLTTNNATSVTEAMRIKADGNVGIGTSSPESLLHLRGSIPTLILHDTNSSVSGDDYGKIQWHTQDSSMPGTNDIGAEIKATDDSTYGDRAAILFSTAHNATSLTERMRIASNGQAGFGSGTFGSNNVLTITNVGNDAAYSAIALGTATTGHGNSEGYWIGMLENGQAYLWNYENQHILFGSNNTERMRIRSDGNVGIGTTSPAARLDVRGALGANGTAVVTSYFHNNTSGATSSAIYIGASSGTDWKIGKNVTGITNNTNFSISDHANNRYLDINSSGSVGIGTNAPGSLLDVYGASGAIESRVRSGSVISRLTANSSTGDGVVGTNSDHNFLIQRNGSTKITVAAALTTMVGEVLISTGSTSVRTLSGVLKADTIENNSGSSNLKLQTEAGGNKHIEITPNGTGNVGIGTSSPAGRLQVNQVASDQSGAAALKVIGTAYGTNKAIHAYMGTGNATKSLLYVENSSGAVMNIAGDGRTTLTGPLTVGADDTGHDVRLYGATSGRYWEWDESMDLVRMRDNVKTVFGNGDDLQIYHDGSNSYIKDAGTGSLLIEVAGTGDSGFYKVGGEKLATFEPDGPVTLYHNNSKKFETTSTGVTVTGLLTATTKSFTIDHPTKPGKKLRYGSLEGPENGVYIRGKSNNNSIELPEYWTKLVDKDSITVQLTAIGKPQQLYVERIENNVVYIQSEENRKKISQLNYYYLINAERIDVGKLQVEIEE